MGLNSENGEIITLEDILDIYYSVNLIPEPEIPFPQADVFDVFIAICKHLHDFGSLTRNEIMEIFQLKPRQYSFYKGAGEYLGLIERTRNSFNLTQEGLNLFSCNYKERNLGIVKLILQHKPFHDVFALYLENGEFPSSNDIFGVLKNNEIYNVNSDVTLKRRSSTVKGWMDWIISLISLN